MNKHTAAALLPVIQALAEGKTIEQRPEFVKGLGGRVVVQ